MSTAPETRDQETEELRAKLAAVERERDEFRIRAERAEHERNEFKKLYELVLFELERLKRQLFGQKAETVEPDQVQLAFAPVLEALERARTGGETAAEEVVSELEKLRERAQAEVARRKAEKKAQKPHGRRDLSLEDLPVEKSTLEPPERLLPGGEALVKIGEEVSEHIDRRPASLVRVQVIRPKYKMPETPVAPPHASIENAGAETGGAATISPNPETLVPEPAVAAITPTANGPLVAAVERARPGSIVIAELPERPIPRGIAGPGLLAYVLVSKFADHRVPRRLGREPVMGP